MVQARVVPCIEMRRHGHVPRIVRDSGMFVEAVCEACLYWVVVHADAAGEYVDSGSPDAAAEEACPHVSAGGPSELMPHLT